MDGLANVSHGETSLCDHSVTGPSAHSVQPSLFREALLGSEVWSRRDIRPRPDVRSHPDVRPRPDVRPPPDVRSHPDVRPRPDVRMRPYVLVPDRDTVSCLVFGSLAMPKSRINI